MKNNNLKWWTKNNNLLIVFIAILIITIVTVAFMTHNRYNSHIEEIQEAVQNSENNKKLEALIKKISVNQDSLKIYGDKEIYLLRKDIISTNEKVANLKVVVEEQHNDWLSYLANFWTIIGFAFGSIAVVFAFKEKVRQEVDKQVKVETEKLIKNNLGVLKNNLDEIKKHNRYKKESKIIIINKIGTEFPNHFKAILKLFNVNIDLEENRVDVENISDINSNVAHLEKLRCADLVLMENVEPSSIWKVSDFKEDYIALAENICTHTSLLYYSGREGGQFPISEVKEELQHFISFTNATSQLYGNMLNLLKYKYELEAKN